MRGGENAMKTNLRRIVMTKKWPIICLSLILFSLIISPVALFADPQDASNNLPSGEKVVSGNVTVDRSIANTLNVNIASQNAIVEWTSFSIASGYTTNFNFNIAQPSLGSILNNVTGPNMSVINGAMNSNGNVLLVNSNGIVFGESSRVNCASMIASTLKIDYDNFLNPVNGQYKFYKDGGNGFIINAGRIAAQPGGYIVLLSQAIDNSGTITVSSIDAKVGRIVLASGERMTVAMDDRSLISVAIEDGVKSAIFGPDGAQMKSAIKNSGSLLADGGRITLTAKSMNKVFDYAINNTGIIQANSVVKNNGIIEFVVEGAPIVNTGRIEAGKVTINAVNTDLFNFGEIISQNVAELPDKGSIYINAVNMLQDGLISSNGVVAIDIDNMNTTQVIIYDPSSLAQDPNAASLPTAVIQGNEVRITFRKLGSTDQPIQIKAPTTYIYRKEGDIDISDSLGLGTSILMRGPPESNFSIIYSKDTNLTLDAAHVTVVGTTPTHFYGNITFSDFICTVPDKEIYFEAGKTYTILGSLEIQGSYAKPVRLISSVWGSPWYIDSKSSQDIYYAWVQDSYNINPQEIIAILSTSHGGCYNWDPTVTWSGLSGANSNWSTGANWVGGSAPGVNDYLQFPDGAARMSNNNDFAAGTGFASIQFTGTSGGYTLNGNRITLGTGGITSSNTSGTNTINLEISMAADRTVTVATGGTLTISDIISGAGGITKDGSGILILTKANTYTGITNVNIGILNIQHKNALGSTAAGTVVSSGAALEIQGGITGVAEPITLNGSGISSSGALKSISGTNSITGAITLESATRINSNANTLTISGGIVGSGYALTVGGAGNVTFTAAAIAGAGTTVTKDGAGTLTYSAANTYTGLTTINAGTLAYGAGVDAIVGDVTVSGGTLDIAGRSDTVGAVTLTSGTITGTTGVLTGTSYTLESGTVNAILGGAGVALTKNTAGTVILTKTNTYTGATTISAGTLQYGANNVLSNSTAVTINGGATLDLNNFLGTVGSVAGFGNITLGSGTLTTGADDTSTTFSGVISGSGDLTKSGTGTLTLSGANTYTGVTTISAGTLSINTLANVSGGASSLGAPTTSLNGTIALGATGILQYTGSGHSSDRVINLTADGGTIDASGSGTLTLTGGVTGNKFNLVLTGNGAGVESGVIKTTSGTLTKNGIGTWTLSGANTYTGATTVNAGTLKAGVASVANTSGAFGKNSAVTMADVASAILDITGFNTQIGSITGGGAAGGNVTLGAATLTVGGDNTSPAAYAGVISGAGAITKIGTGTFTLSGANTYTGKTSIQNGILSATSINSVGGAASSLGMPTTVSNGTIDLGATNTTGQLTYTGGAATSDRVINLAGTTGDGVIDQSGTGLLKFTSDFTATGAGDKTLTLQGSTTGTGEIAGKIVNYDGTRITSVIKTGTGTWTLSGANTYTGLTTVSAGTLAYGANNVISTGDVTVSSGATLDLAGYSDSFGALTVTGSSVTTSGGNLTLTSTLKMTGGSISTGSGTLTLGGNVTGNASATSSTISGKLDLGAATRVFTIANGAAADDMLISAVIRSASGAFGINKAGLGTLTLSGANTYIGATTLNAGKLNINNSTALGTGTFDISGGDIDNTSGGPITLTNNNLQTWSSNFTFTGTNNLNLGTGGVTINATRTVTVDAGNLTVGGVITGGAGDGLTKDGSGTLILSGVNTYTGITKISMGTLSVATIGDGGVAGNLGQATNAAANLVLGGGTLQYTGATASTNRNFTLTTGTTSTIDITTAGTDLTISGASTNTTGALTKVGSGTLTLSGTNLYTGTTTVNAGTITCGVNNAFSSSTVMVSSGATLDIVGYNFSAGGTSFTNNGLVKLQGLSTQSVPNIAGSVEYTGTGTALKAGNSYTNLTFSGTVEYTGTGTALKAGNSYTNLTFSGTGTYTLASNLSVSSSVIVGVNDILDLVSYNLTGGASVTNNGLVKLQGLSTQSVPNIAGSVEYTGTGTALKAGNSYTNLTFSGTDRHIHIR
ncbi:MAG: autotransporter-associated beta strand repeat-containing protein [Candidatus Omnitrophica bacterium]|nr:autotransporter-associated beta strand repeat-containing protein [Candidatus Omnitrophota bacterium]